MTNFDIIYYFHTFGLPHGDILQKLVTTTRVGTARRFSLTLAYITPTRVSPRQRKKKVHFWKSAKNTAVERLAICSCDDPPPVDKVITTGRPKSAHDESKNEKIIYSINHKRKFLLKIALARSFCCRVYLPSFRTPKRVGGRGGSCDYFLLFCHTSPNLSRIFFRSAKR